MQWMRQPLGANPVGLFASVTYVEVSWAHIGRYRGVPLHDYAICRTVAVRALHARGELRQTSV